MGLFNKIKNMFKNNDVSVEEKDNLVTESSNEVHEDNVQEEVKEEVKVYEKGLTKSREGFVSKLAELGVPLYVIKNHVLRGIRM